VYNTSGMNRPHLLLRSGTSWTLTDFLIMKLGDTSKAVNKLYFCTTSDPSLRSPMCCRRPSCSVSYLCSLLHPINVAINPFNVPMLTKSSPMNHWYSPTMGMHIVHIYNSEDACTRRSEAADGGRPTRMMGSRGAGVDGKDEVSTTTASKENAQGTPATRGVPRMDT